ncbi:transposase [Erwinia tasmaniensis]|uniref:transposase n=1 Tax=Erwinia tasmaniensis TaxID=338565 RepID=UPI003A4D4788
MAFWLDDEPVQAWYVSVTPPSQGRPQRSSYLAITALLIVKRIFPPTLRTVQGFLIPLLL